MSQDLSFLQPAYEHEGPFASVVLETDHSPEDAAHAIDVRWRGLRSELESLGADADTLGALDEVVGTPSGIGGERGQLAVAAAGEVVLDERLFGQPSQTVARWERLPYVVPLLQALADQVPCLVVRVDSVGADIEVRGPWQRREVEVQGEDHPVHKTHRGGLTHHRIQQRVEDTVRHNAKLVAQRVDELVRMTGVELVMLAGESRARTEVTDELSGDSRGLVVDLDGGSRHADGQDVDDLVADVVREQARASAESLTATYREQLDKHRRGVAGLDPTVTALRQARVGTVLVEENVSDESSLWVGDDPLAIAHQPDVLEGLGIASKYRVPATSALARAAAGSGAGVGVVAAGTTSHRDGVGALLRYAHDPAGANA